MGKVTHLPPPGPDDPIFSEGFLITGMPRLKGPETAKPEPGAEIPDDDEESKALDSPD